MNDRYNCTTGGMEIAEWPGGDYVDASDYDALAAELAKWKRKHQVEVGWACAKVEESADRINALEASLRRIQRGVDCSEQSYEYAEEVLAALETSGVKP